MKGSELAQAFFDSAKARDWSAVAALHTDDHAYHDPQGPKPEPGSGSARCRHRLRSDSAPALGLNARYARTSGPSASCSRGLGGDPSSAGPAVRRSSSSTSS